MKSAFSLLELIFAIVILGIIASFAVPKYLETKDTALIATLKRDVNTVVSSIQSYYLLNQNIEKISDALVINNTNWVIEDTKMRDKHSCVSIEIKSSNENIKYIELVIDDSKDSTICKKIRESNLVNNSYELY